MIEFWKMVLSALITAGATILALFLKRNWDVKDKSDEQHKSVEDRLDKMAESVERLSDKVDSLDSKVGSLSTEMTKEVTETDLKNRCLQAGLREMLYDRIKFLAHKYIAEGKIREEEYKSINRMWSVYHNDLVGNGYLDEEMAKVRALEKV